MENNSNGTAITELVEKNYEILKKVERVSILVFLLGFIFHILKINGTDFILIIGAVLTAIVFFLQAFKIVEFENFESFNVLGSPVFTNFIFKLNFISLSVSMMAMLGFVIDFPKGNVMLTVGGFTLIVILILTLFANIQEKSKIYNQLFYLRILICLAFLVYLGVNKGFTK
jgi:hypothetical protein